MEARKEAREVEEEAREERRETIDQAVLLRTCSVVWSTGLVQSLNIHTMYSSLF